MKKMATSVVAACIASSALAATCWVDVTPVPNACSLTTLNDCPVVPVADGQCGTTSQAQSGWDKSDPYSQVCYFKAQKKDAAGNCKEISPPEYHSWTANNCNRAAGATCKVH